MPVYEPWMLRAAWAIGTLAGFREAWRAIGRDREAKRD